MDSLLAFWPGLQVLSGDLKPAVETHEMLYQVMQMHTFIPEAFTFDFQVEYYSKFPLRFLIHINLFIDTLGTASSST